MTLLRRKRLLSEPYAIQRFRRRDDCRCLRGNSCWTAKRPLEKNEYLLGILGHRRQDTGDRKLKSQALYRTQKQDRCCVSVKFGRNLRASCSGVQRFAYLILIFSMGPGKTSVQLRILSADMVRHNHLGQSRMTLDQSYVAEENPLQHAYSLVRRLGTRLLSNFLQPVVQPIHYSRPKSFLGGKVAKYCCLRETDCLSNQLSAHGISTVFGHQRQRHLDDLLFAFLGIESFAGHDCKHPGSSSRLIFNIFGHSENNCGDDSCRPPLNGAR